MSWSLVTLGTALVQDMHQMLATRVLLGFAESAYLPAAIALIADHHGVKTRGTALGIHLAGLSAGLVAGGAGAGYAGDHFGWRFGFVLLGGVGVALTIVTRLVLKDTEVPKNPAPRSPVRDLLELVRIPSYMILLFEAMLISIGTWMFFNWLPLYFKERYGMSLTMAGFSGTFIPQLATTAGVVLGGYSSDWIARGRSERRMLMMSTCYLMSAPLLFAFRMGPTADILNICILSYSFLRALGSSNEGPLMCDLLEPRLRSTAIALCNTANCFAGGVGVFVTGYLKHDVGLAGAFSFVSLITIVAAASTFIGYVFFMRDDLKLRFSS
jgi:predicted MFS family arabinose efflux permease